MPQLKRTDKASIKAYFVDRLTTKADDGSYPTLAGARVYPNRFGPFQEDELPAIVVYATEENCEFLDVTEDRRHLKMSLECQAVGDDADSVLDVLSDQIVDLFRNDEYLGGFDNGLVEWCRYSRGQLFYDEKRHLNGICWVVEFEVRYIWQTAPDPESYNLTPFEGVDVAYKFAEGNPQPPIVVELTDDSIEIPQ